MISPVTFSASSAALKSVRTARPSSAISRLSGLMSRCRTPAACRCTTAEKASRMSESCPLGVSRTFELWRRRKSDPWWKSGSTSAYVGGARTAPMGTITHS
eukprot:scaffold171475_cov31-Tisochrysis_lutea.AAC.5